MRRAATVLVLLACGAAAHALEVNTASQAELESVKGIGVAMSTAILEARAQRPFADWADLARRVKGAGARRFADAGLTVNGAAYPSASPTAAGRAASAAASAPSRP